jgi:hypothetical protein
MPTTQETGSEPTSVDGLCFCFKNAKKQQQKKQANNRA